jgi:hypothetical protein
MAQVKSKDRRERERFNATQEVVADVHSKIGL